MNRMDKMKGQGQTPRAKATGNDLWTKSLRQSRSLFILSILFILSKSSCRSSHPVRQDSSAAPP
jgi:hypothetical protein